MDTIDSCKGKLASLRIKDLKDILTQLGISKQGKKQDLVERIITIFSSEQAKNVWTKKKTAGREEIAKLVNDAYRKVQVSGATDVASKGQDESDGSSIKINCLVNDPSDYDKKVRCLCGSFLEMDSLIKCEDIKCSVWQHFKCVIIPEKPMEVSPLVPSSFYCELCRLNRADPFWVTVSNPLFPVKLMTTNVPTDGSNPWQSAERTFQLTRADKDLLMKPEYDVQAWCMLLNDKVLFRMQWPQYADLQVNGVPIRVINRPGQQPLGANGRDDGAIITPCTKDGINKIVLTGCDARVFCLGVRIAKRQSVQQILKLIPKESDGEYFDDALARVCRCVGGGNEAENADSDSDIEVVADFITVNLRCPMSGLRMKVVGRFKPCAHMGCFDLEVFVELNQRSRKWQCPICLKNYSLEDIIIDPYFNRITSKMRNCDEDVTEVEVKPDGSWRVKCKTENERRDLQDLAEWHLPNGSLSSPVSVANQNVAIKLQVKQEESESATGLKLGIRKNPNCFWEFNRPEGLKSSSSRLEDKLFGCNVQNIIPMSSSATGSGRDEDQSINQESSGILDFANNGIELDSTCLNIDSLFGVSDRNLTSAAGNTDVIVLTDSDEENDILIPSGPANSNWQTDSVPFPLASTGIADSFPDNTTGKSGGPSSLALCNENAEEFGMHLWQSTPGIGGQGFQLFSTDAGVSGLVDIPRYSNGIPSSSNSFLSGTEPVLDSSDIIDNSLGQNHMNIHDNYTVYPYPFDGDDPSLQIFLPTRPDNELTVPHVRAQGDVSNILRSDDWISLRLGDGGGNNHDITPSTSVFDKPQHMSSRNEEVSLGAVDLEQIYSNGFNTTSEHAPSDNGLNITQQMPSTQASVLLEVNKSRSEKANKQKSEGVFSFPRQKRSVRPRLHLSIGSGSE